MDPYYRDDQATLYHGDCVEVLRGLPEASVDAVVTDPPYGIRFMGQAWDGADIVERTARGRETSPMPSDVGGPRGGYRSLASEAGRYDLSENAAFGEWCREWASECLRVLRPGGHLLAFGGSRTWHRLASGIEDAGFELRDSIAWIYGSGFPKSLDVAKAIDRAAGVWRGRAGKVTSGNGLMSGGNYEMSPKGDPVTAAASVWDGLGTALKPSFDPIVVARKPLDGTVAENVLAHGTGVLNIDGCRVGVAGRWPANIVLDGSQAEALDEQSGVLHSGTMRKGTERQPRTGGVIYGADTRTFVPADTYGDSGGASRFFPIFRYEAKAGSSERPSVGGVRHPTVKPVSLMQWLARLVTPPHGLVLDPFGGSGTTGEACLLEGFRCILIEREADYLPLIVQRLTSPVQTAFDFEGEGA